MAEAISNDLRERIIASWKKGKSVKEIMEQFDVKRTFVYNLIELEKETGSIEKRPQNAGRKAILTESQLEEIRQTIIQTPDITLLELKEQLGLPVCISALCRTIKNKLKFNYKKNTISKRTK